uniref:Uncharacterized protein n=1 Tax=viral metagenome TaxID=1070528 RepID=A0A6C0DFZ9_9ZZZZ
MKGNCNHCENDTTEYYNYEERNDECHHHCHDTNFILDVAVLCQEYSPVEVTCNNSHIVNLDEISINEETFRNIFYPYGETFGIDPKKSCVKEFFYLTFLAPYRKVNGRPFSLLEEVIKNTEEDLNVSRNCFTTCSLIDLSNDLSKIKTLCDINCSSLVCSLTWSNIISMLRDYSLVNKHPRNISPLFVVNVIFKSPNPCVKPTVVKFNYRVHSICMK